jgi:glycolate oxidase FAD binding subunit
LAFVRLEGPEQGIAVRAERAIALVRQDQPGVTADRLDPSAGEALWREIGGGLAFAGAAFTGWDVWRLSVAPTGAAAIADRLTADGPGAVQFDWGGGLLWYAHPPRRRRHEAIREAIVANGGGHATLIRAKAETRAVVPVFEPQPPAMAALTARIKHAFDPRAVLNPGRMYEGV